MNETMKILIETRRSCKKYKPDMITQEELDAVIKAGTYAPTGGNKQTPIIIAVTNKELRDELSVANGKIAGAPEGFDVFYGAPVVLIVIADKGENNENKDFEKDGSLVMGNLLNAAASLGLGSCWINRAKEEFEQEIGKRILDQLGLKGNYEGIGHCILGYPDGPMKEAAPRKDNYVYYIK